MNPKIELLNIDCLEYMKGVPDKYFELAIVDPPYGGGQHFNFRYGTGEQVYENRKPETEYWQQLFRVSKNQIVWGANYFTDNLPENRCWISWYKGNPINAFSDFELAWTSFDRTSRSIRLESYGFNHADKRHSGNSTIHPTQKPVSLYKELLREYATCDKCNNTGGLYEDVVGDGGSRMLVDCEWCAVAENGSPKILDTHLGSGSIAIACHDLGFDLVGCEKVKGYYEDAVKRFENHKKQLQLFK